MKRYVALLCALVALVVGVAADATSGRVAVTNRVAVTRITSIANLPGLRWWVQPSGIVATDAVDSWTDSSASGFTLSETGTNRPTLATAVLNGFNGVTFTKASSQRLSRANTQIVTGAGTGITVCMVLRPDTTDSALQIYWDNINGGVSQGFEFGVSTGNKYDGIFLSIGGTLANTVATGAFHVACWHQPGFATGEFIYDGTAQTLSNILVPGTASPLTATSTGTFRLGGRGNGTTHANFTMVEAFACEGDLDSRFLAAARTLWKAKYASLP